MYKIISVTDNHIFLSTHGNKTIKMDRFCTHEGGDLALGYVDDEVIRCPLHSLPFCLKTGTQPCKTLKNLEVTSE